MSHKISETDWVVFYSELSRWSGVKAFPEVFRESLTRYLGLLLARNEVVNLTAIDNFEEGVWKHLLDSLALTHFPDLGICVDWGTGGGLPGIPLLLWRRDVLRSEEAVFFLDSVGKKIASVEGFLEALSLNSPGRVRVGRGEVLLREMKVDTVLLRAVAPPERAVPWFSRAAKQWVVFCGPKNREEWLKARSRLGNRGFVLKEEFSYSLPKGLGDRFLLKFAQK